MGRASGRATRYSVKEGNDNVTVIPLIPNVVNTITNLLSQIIDPLVPKVEDRPTTQKEEPGSSQSKGEPEIITVVAPVVAPVVVEDIVTDVPRTLAEFVDFPVKRENTLNKVIAGLFMGGIALAFMGGLKKK